MKIFNLTVLALISVVFSACKKTRQCEEPIDIRYFSSLTFVFKDSSGNYIYADEAPIYELDSLIIKTVGDSSVPLFYGKSNVPGSTLKYTYVGISPVYSQLNDQNAFGAEICKSYFIQFSYNDVDTINVCFKSKYTACGSLFETFKVYRRGVLINSSDGISPQITITKH